MDMIKKLWKYIEAYQKQLLLSLIAASIVVIGTLLVPYYFGHFIDLFASADTLRMKDVYHTLFVIGIWVLITTIFTRIMNVVNNRITYRVIEDLRIR